MRVWANGRQCYDRKIERSADASQGDHALSLTPSEEAPQQTGSRERSAKWWAVVLERCLYYLRHRGGAPSRLKYTFRWDSCLLLVNGCARLSMFVDCVPLLAWRI